MKRTVLVALIFILAGWICVPPAYAQAINPAPSAEDFGATVDNKTTNGQMSKEVYTVNTQVLYLDSMSCLMTGCSNDPNSAFYYGKSALASLNNVILAMYDNPPANLALWVHKTAQDLGFEPKQVNAQGIGFSGLSVLLPIWEGFRNIAYGLLAIVMVVIGFMVMFRKKIDPKTVVTVQNALPKIVLTLILITFSYAIVGLMIDLMYVAIALIAALLVPASQGALGADTISTYLNSNLGTLLKTMWNTSWPSGTSIATLLGLGDIHSSSVFSMIMGYISGGIMTAIVAVALIFGIVRVVFLLVGAYIQILISLFIGPLQILTEAFPGSSGFSSWFKNLFANVAVFPITAGLLMIGTILAHFNQNGQTVWGPPLLAAQGSNGWVGVIGLGLLFSIPGIANSLKEAIKAKGVNAGPGAIFGPIGSSVGSGLNTFYQGTMAFSMLGGKGHAQKTPKETNDLGQGTKAATEGVQPPTDTNK